MRTIADRRCLELSTPLDVVMPNPQWLPVEQRCSETRTPFDAVTPDPQILIGSDRRCLELSTPFDVVKLDLEQREWDNRKEVGCCGARGTNTLSAQQANVADYYILLQT